MRYKLMFQSIRGLFISARIKSFVRGITRFHTNTAVKPDVIFILVAIAILNGSFLSYKTAY